MSWAADLAALAAAFLCGTIPFGVLVVRATRGVDVRTVGSGNIGATNAARAAGLTTGLLVLLLDAAKGAAAVLLGRWLAAQPPAPWTAGALPAAAVAGHVFTPWLRFRGGKGVAAALGALLATDLRLAAAGAAAFVAVVLATRFVSAASLALAGAMVVGTFVWRGAGLASWLLAGAGALIVLRHKDNVQRLIAGTEPRFGAGGSRGGAS